METGVTERDRNVEALIISERLAEARHNEKFGWGAVIMAAFLVVTLTMATSPLAPVGSAVVGPAPMVVLPGGVVLGGLDVAAGMMLLSVVLVVLGVAVALYCRFVRTRLFDDLARAVEVAIGGEPMQEERREA